MSKKIEKESKKPHFLTLTVIEWINIFTKRKYFEILIENLKFYQRKGLQVHAYVLMTNHLHLIVSSKRKPLANLIQSFKSYTTREIKKALEKDERKHIIKLIKNSFSKRRLDSF